MQVPKPFDGDEDDDGGGRTSVHDGSSEIFDYLNSTKIIIKKLRRRQ